MEGKTKRKHSRGDNNGPMSPPKKELSDAKQINDEKSASNVVRVKDKIDRSVDHNLDRKVFAHEENLADSDGAPMADLTEFRQTCQSIAGVVTEINTMKKEENEEGHPGIPDKRTNAMLLTTGLKKLNRLTQIRGRNARESTIEVKAKVDGMHLALQNLHYEILRMRKEIEKCMNFSSKDEEIDLVSVDKFYQEAPPEVSKPDATKKDPHKQMLARLAWELKTRKELAVKKAEFLEGKKKIQLEIDEKSDYLVNLKPRLDQIIRASLPVQEFMGMPIEAERLIFEKAQFLPRSLYVLYVQAKAFKDACDNGMTVGIEGDITEAKSELISENVKEDLSDDSDTETHETGEEGQKRGSRMTRSEKQQQHNEARQKRLFETHPLTVVIQISRANQYDLHMKFSHLPVLRITAVSVKIELNHELQVFSFNSLLEPSVILRDLLSPDTGKASPNPTNKYQLNKLGVTDFSTHMTPIGVPYYWVQWICGMNYLPDEEIQSLIPNSALSIKHFQSVVQTITSRLDARLSLVKQLQLLEQLTIPPPKNKNLVELNPPKIVSMLTAWKFAPFEECSNFPTFSELLADGMVSEGCLAYLATFTREESLTSLIILHENYPARPPLILLSMDDGTPEVDKLSKLFCLEREINAYAEDLMAQDDKNMILSNMLRKLQICFDMFVETGEQHYAKEKLYMRKTSGRDRNRPYKYHKDGYFVHR